jgi:hypothetical protein
MDLQIRETSAAGSEFKSFPTDGLTTTLKDAISDEAAFQLGERDRLLGTSLSHHRKVMKVLD